MATLEELNVQYLGMQEGYGSIPAHPLYLDLVTGSTFGVLPNQSIREEAEECRKRFRREQ
jgi:hypothetical protein